MKKILITGKNGQLGQHLVKFFQDNFPEFDVIGTVRHKSFDKQPIIFDDKKIITELLDLTDSVSIDECVKKWKPDYIFNTAANAFVGESWKVPHQHFQINTIGVVNLLEAIRKFSPETRFVNLGTSEEFACTKNNNKPQNEDTLISPRSPYGCSKAASRYMVDVYRESYGLFAVQPWCFNFESEIRGEKYLTRKVSLGVAKIMDQLDKGSLPDPIELGNLESYRSWQYAGDVADALWRVANQSDDARKWKPYVISENGTHSIREFVEESFSIFGIEISWYGNGLKEKAISFSKTPVRGPWEAVAIKPEFFRPLDVTYLYGDSSKLRQELGWEPKTSFKDLVKKMVLNDYEQIKNS